MNNDKLKEITGMKIMMVESIIGYQFPDSFKNFYKSCEDKIDINITINDEKKNINGLYSFDSDSKLYIVKYINFNSKYSSILIPFAYDGDDNLLCFDKNTNYVFYYDRLEDNIYKVSDTFEELI